MALLTWYLLRRIAAGPALANQDLLNAGLSTEQGDDLIQTRLI